MRYESSRLRHMPSQQFASEATAEDQDFKPFRFRHELPPSKIFALATLTLTWSMCLQASAGPARSTYPAGGSTVSRPGPSSRRPCDSRRIPTQLALSFVKIFFDDSYLIFAPSISFFSNILVHFRAFCISVFYMRRHLIKSVNTLVYRRIIFA